MALLILMSSIIAWVTVAAMSAPAGEVQKTTDLTFEYIEPAVVVNSIQTNHILTHPDYVKLGKTHTDSYTTSNAGWNLAWSFYLYGPLEQDYTMNGRLVFPLYLYANRECEVNIWFKIRDVDESGTTTYADNIKFWKEDLGMSSPHKPIVLESDPVKSKTFKEGHSILIEIRLKSDSKTETTYYFDYDSDKKYSRIEFPGIVVPESVLYLILFAPLIPIAVLKMKNRRENR